MNPTPDTIPAPADADSAGPQVISLTDTVVEIVSDAGEGVQKAGVSLCDRLGQNGQRHMDSGNHSPPIFNLHPGTLPGQVASESA